MNKQPGSTLSTTINGSRSCYITNNRFAFLSVETILARTIDISNNILNCFRTLFKNVNPCTKRLEKGIYLIFKRNIAHLTHRQTHIADLENHFCREIEKSFFCRQSLPKHFAFGENTSPMIIMALLSYAQSVLHIVIALKNVTLLGNKKSILVEMFDFTVTQVDNFCKNELITVMLKFFDGKDTSLVLFKPKRYSNLSI